MAAAQELAGADCTRGKYGVVDDAVGRVVALDGGEDGAGLPFAFWYEDGEGPDSSFSPNEDGTPGGRNDWTTRGPEASARQYYSTAKLLRIGEYANIATAVESSTWGKIKDSFQ